MNERWRNGDFRDIGLGKSGMDNLLLSGVNLAVMVGSYKH